MIRRARSIVAFFAVGGALALGACVLAEPPTTLPTLPDLRPTIVRASVVPTASAVLATWPSKFIVPVELIDPRVTLTYATFVDYNSLCSSCYETVATSEYEPGTTTGSVRTLEVLINKPSSDKCHLIEIVVAKNLDSRSAQSAHSPEPNGDIVSWFYNPSGDLDGCPSVDAGIAPIADAGDDG